MASSTLGNRHDLAVVEITGDGGRDLRCAQLHEPSLPQGSEGRTHRGLHWHCLRHTFASRLVMTASISAPCRICWLPYPAHLPWETSHLYSAGGRHVERLVVGLIDDHAAGGWIMERSRRSVSGEGTRTGYSPFVPRQIMERHTVRR
jgi:hypothetical protein